MVNTPVKNLSPLLVGKYIEPTKQATRRCQQESLGESSLEQEMFRALGAVRSRSFKQRLSAENSWETNCFSHKEAEKWIEDYVDRETAVVRKRVEGAESAIMQE